MTLALFVRFFDDNVINSSFASFMSNLSSSHANQVDLQGKAN
jgi:hypothetical protein